MDYQNQATEQALLHLFHGFLDAGLHGRFEEALNLLSEQYAGVGMGEQGIVSNKEEAMQVLQYSYLPVDGTVIEYEIKRFSLNFLSENVAVIIGEVVITNIPQNGKAMSSGIMQSVGACLENGSWRISFTHASPTVLTAKSVEAYPIRFMENTLSMLRADLHTETLPHYDSLTGILNRKGLEHRSAELIYNYNPEHNIALFMIDLDDFKQINDHLGHQAGDAVLQQVASILQNAFKDSDAVGRIGGDEFMVLLTGDFSEKFLKEKADELLNTMRMRLTDNQEIPVSISIGIAHEQTCTTFETLYSIADIALYAAKKAGKCRYHLINSDTTNQSNHTGSGINLISLQTLLHYTDSRNANQFSPESLLENIPGGIVLFKLSGSNVKLIHYNHWMYCFLGYTQQEYENLEKDNAFALLHPDDIPSIRNIIEQMCDGIEQIDIVYQFLGKDGKYRHLRINACKSKSPTNNDLYYGLVTDVEDMAQMQNQLEYANLKLESLLSGIHGSITPDSN